MTAVEASAERAESISWLELFFDLVVVAAVSVLTEGLHEDLGWHGVGMTVLVYATIWTSWSLTVLYANVAQEQTHVRTMTLSMLLIAIMTASAPIHEAGRANLFVGAFLVLRLVVSRGSLSTGRVLASFPLLQFGGMAVPWLASLWVDPPYKYWLWAAALVFDLVLVMTRGDQMSDQYLGHVQERMGQHRGPKGPRTTITMVKVDVDRSHLDERLGLFVIIVLGEAVIQVVHAAAVRPWDGEFEAIALGAFVLLLGLWRHTFAHGFSGAPHTSLADLPPRFGLPLHLLSTLGLVGIAAALAELLAHPGAEVEQPVSWLLAGGMALHFGVGLVSGVAGRAPRRWLYGWAGASTAYAVLLGFAGPLLSAAWFTWAAAIPAIWQVFAGRPVTREEKAVT